MLTQIKSIIILIVLSVELIIVRLINCDQFTEIRFSRSDYRLPQTGLLQVGFARTVNFIGLFFGPCRRVGTTALPHKSVRNESSKGFRGVAEIYRD